MSSSLKSVLVPVTDGIPSTLELTLTQVVPAGTLLRLRASSVTMLRAIAVASVTVDDDVGSVLLSRSFHRFSWEAMQRDWMWHLRTLSIAVVSVPTELAKGSRVAVACKAVSGDRIEHLRCHRCRPDLGSLSWQGGQAGSIEFVPVSEAIELQFRRACGSPRGRAQAGRTDICGDFDVYGTGRARRTR